MWFMQNAMAKPDNAGAGSTDYMHLFGSSPSATCGRAWPRPPPRLASGDATEAAFHQTKLTLAKHFMERHMPETALRLARVETGADTIMGLDAEAFLIASAMDARPTPEKGAPQTAATRPPRQGRRQRDRASECSSTRPDWMDDELTMLDDMPSAAFWSARSHPHYEAWVEAGCVDPRRLEGAGTGGFLCAGHAGRLWRAGGTFAHEAVIIRRLGLAGTRPFRHCAAFRHRRPLHPHYGSAEQKERWLPGLVSGDLIGAIAMTEPGAGSDLQACRQRP
jgi:hypothetical protein